MTTCLGKSCSFGLPLVPFVNCCQFICLVVSLLVLREGCGIWLHQFPIIAYLFSLSSLKNKEVECLDHLDASTKDHHVFGVMVHFSSAYLVKFMSKTYILPDKILKYLNWNHCITAILRNQRFVPLTSNYHIPEIAGHRLSAVDYLPF